MKKRIVLCADDYGQAREISQGIVSLIENGSLTATSCMVNSHHWPDHARWLLPVQNKIDIGMHFNLTEGEALSREFKAAYGEKLIPLRVLLRRAFWRRLEAKPLIAECHAQLDRFINALGRNPDFVDGHQHVHQFPVIRSALLAVYNERLRAGRTYLRVVKPPVFGGGAANSIKKIIIRATGSRRFEKLLLKAQIPHNASFSGIYAFDQAQEYPRLFRRFLSEIGDNGLIMCHPGLSGGADTIASARYEEYQYLASDQLRIDCASSGAVLCRYGTAPFIV